MTEEYESKTKEITSLVDAIKLYETKTKYPFDRFKIHVSIRYTFENGFKRRFTKPDSNRSTTYILEEGIELNLLISMWPHIKKAEIVCSGEGAEEYFDKVINNE